MMSLDEAIEHARDKAQGSSPCALEHAALCSWLKELKDLRKHEICMCGDYVRAHGYHSNHYPVSQTDYHIMMLHDEITILKSEIAHLKNTPSLAEGAFTWLRQKSPQKSLLSSIWSSLKKKLGYSVN